jgi:hypothetical protein
MRDAGTLQLTKILTPVVERAAIVWDAGPATAAAMPLGMSSRVFCSDDLAMRLQEEPFVVAFPIGWRYECVWETVTRQDAELLLKVFRDVCGACAPAGCSAACELVLLPLPAVLRIMDAIVDKAKYR